LRIRRRTRRRTAWAEGQGEPVTGRTRETGGITLQSTVGPSATSAARAAAEKVNEPPQPQQRAAQPPRRPGGGGSPAAITRAAGLSSLILPVALRAGLRVRHSRTAPVTARQPAAEAGRRAGHGLSHPLPGRRAGNYANAKRRWLAQAITRWRWLAARASGSRWFPRCQSPQADGLSSHILPSGLRPQASMR